jgi:signal transduction histidine kinase
MLETIRRQSSTLASQARSLGWQEIAREVVHESRNLLTPLKLGAEGLVERAINDSDESLARDGKQLMAGLGALERMTASLKDLSTHRFPKMEVIDVDPVLQSVAEIHRGRAADIVIEADTGCVVVGDGDLLAEALGNMVTNALEAGARRVVLSARRDQRNVAITCADDGRGIASENLARVPMLGFSTKPSGSGFGLYFANKLAKQLDGRVEIESEPGRGTRVRMVLRHAHDIDDR